MRAVTNVARITRVCKAGSVWRQLKKRVLPPGVLPRGKTRFLPRLAASISRSPRLAARSRSPAASVRSTRGKTWRQKPLECAACFRRGMFFLGTVIWVRNALPARFALGADVRKPKLAQLNKQILPAVMNFTFDHLLYTFISTGNSD
jgi:hypothetical protein